MDDVRSGDVDVQRPWIRAALLSFIGAGLLGVVLRLAFVFELPDWIVFKNIRHAHSHVAMLGWLYSGLFIFIVWSFLKAESRFHNLFWMTQVVIIGMFFSFSIQGYGPASIVFSSTHIILSYFFVFWTVRHVWPQLRDGSWPAVFLTSSLGFLVLSTLGAWSLGPLLANTGRSSLYYGAIQFYLHFQFNGWFIFAALAIFLKYLQSRGLKPDTRYLRKCYIWLMISCFLTFALAISWSNPHKVIFLVNSTGVILQLLSLYYLFLAIKPVRMGAPLSSSLIVIRMWQLAIFCLVAKIMVQSLVAIPYIATISYTVRNFIVGFIHLLMLGCISSFILGLILITLKPSSQLILYGLLTFVAGFLLSEGLLFAQGIFLWATMGFIPFYDELLLGVSILMPLGIILFAIPVFRSRLA